MNDRPDIARLAGADGVHLGQDDLDPVQVRAFLGAEALIGFSTHNKEQIRSALGLPVDYVAIGPIFETHTKARPDPTVGCSLVAEARSLTRGALVAIGGISLESLPAVFAAGASGVALASAVCSAQDIARAFRELSAALPA